MVSLMHSGSVSLVFCSWDLAITPSATPHPIPKKELMALGPFRSTFCFPLEDQTPLEKQAF